MLETREHTCSRYFHGIPPNTSVLGRHIYASDDTRRNYEAAAGYRYDPDITHLLLDEAFGTLNVDFG